MVISLPMFSPASVFHYMAQYFAGASLGNTEHIAFVMYNSSTFSKCMTLMTFYVTVY